MCVDCEVGFYKDNAEPNNVCEACPDGFVTPTNASISVDNCTVCKSIVMPTRVDIA